MGNHVVAVPEDLLDDALRKYVVSDKLEVAKPKPVKSSKPGCASETGSGPSTSFVNRKIGSASAKVALALALGCPEAGFSWQQNPRNRDKGAHQLIFAH